MRFTVLVFNNADLQNEAVIERITVRSDTGEVVHDSGPKAGVDHPLNMGPIPPRNITVVPPGATFSFSTSDIWGFNPVPGFETAGAHLISLRVEVAKAGKPALFQVTARELARERFITPTGAVVGAERSASTAPCFRVERQD